MSSQMAALREMSSSSMIPIDGRNVARMRKFACDAVTSRAGPGGDGVACRPRLSSVRSARPSLDRGCQAPAATEPPDPLMVPLTPWYSRPRPMSRTPEPFATPSGACPSSTSPLPIDASPPPPTPTTAASTPAIGHRERLQVPRVPESEQGSELNAGRADAGILEQRIQPGCMRTFRQPEATLPGAEPAAV